MDDAIERINRHPSDKLVFTKRTALSIGYRFIKKMALSTLSTTGARLGNYEILRVDLPPSNVYVDT